MKGKTQPQFLLILLNKMHQFYDENVEFVRYYSLMMIKYTYNRDKKIKVLIIKKANLYCIKYLMFSKNSDIKKMK